MCCCQDSEGKSERGNTHAAVREFKIFVHFECVKAGFYNQHNEEKLVTLLLTTAKLLLSFQNSVG